VQQRRTLVLCGPWPGREPVKSRHAAAAGRSPADHLGPRPPWAGHRHRHQDGEARPAARERPRRLPRLPRPVHRTL
jgi:hypothetical protein